MSNAPTVKHTPLAKTEKFWETNEVVKEPETTEELLKAIITKLDTIIEKMTKE